LAVNDDMDCAVLVWMGALYASAFPANATSAAQIAIPVSNDFVMIVPSVMVQRHKVALHVEWPLSHTSKIS
jgi:hypothetical protein